MFLFNIQNSYSELSTFKEDNKRLKLLLEESFTEEIGDVISFDENRGKSLFLPIVAVVTLDSKIPNTIKKVIFINSEGQIINEFSLSEKEEIAGVQISKDSKYMLIETRGDKEFFANYGFYTREGEKIWYKKDIVDAELSRTGEVYILFNDMIYFLDKRGKEITRYSVEKKKEKVGSFSAFSENGKYCIVEYICDDGTKAILFEDNRKILWKKGFVKEVIHDTTISNNGSVSFVARRGGEYFIYTLDKRGKVIWEKENNYSSVYEIITNLIVSPKCDLLFARDQRNTLHIIDNLTGAEITKRKFRDSMCISSTSSDGEIVSLILGGKKLLLLKKGEEIVQYISDRVNIGKISNDGKMLFIGEGNKLKVYEVK